MRATGSSGPIAENERRFRLLFDANVVGVTISDGERVLEANDAWLELTGHTRAELDAGELSWRAMTPAEFGPGDDQRDRAARARGLGSSRTRRSTCGPTARACRC